MGEDILLDSGRQKTQFDLLREGLANKEIAARLNISESAVKKMNSLIYAKLGVTCRLEFFRKYGFANGSKP